MGSRRQIVPQCFQIRQRDPENRILLLLPTDNYPQRTTPSELFPSALWRPAETLKGCGTYLAQSRQWLSAANNQTERGERHAARITTLGTKADPTPFLQTRMQKACDDPTSNDNLRADVTAEWLLKRLICDSSVRWPYGEPLTFPLTFHHFSVFLYI